ncbi:MULTISPECIES: cell wall hydrolase [unclassified Mesorhizobium]|uniref:cell wall hydrolase n=1 Tax=unclassified Mesorhizobium TaxID=325217 RepID=UPI000FD8B2B2|nr:MULTISPECIES: cell wall hydrolase [unclassified Mesorhizobium]TGR38295.1 cell wall hydrolase [bacterium M00.F.Ca.ET.199.01.1.1]TGU26580.1 cell wall hydrolase [bacterium M00.F.Ca.ET.156.01.1.1]TGV83297.1 cell wall hydrolase [Mesorhizobium sp. M00.F.Ca.ET.149.01.1.1]TGR19978.1 cell wall hydrolase [Mesorhizobium sp. M8A.F.Ca.ET.202.01.1.1]TGR21269.1 cell wall hydrolase [Mesorhizobium sp. M8A.F.Ca.ET.197.01.1.1]
MIATRWKTPLLLGVVTSPLFLAACSQTTSHGMSVASLTDAITPSFLSSRAYSHTPKDRECLERAMFFESNRSSRDGMIAVGTVVMNRLRSGNHGSTICQVVGEPGQFAPGVMTRPMNSRAMPDVEEAADAVLKGERKAKLKNTMYFHTAGLRFPYKNMHYTMVAGGNAFYEKRGRNWQPLPDEPTVAIASAEQPAALPGVPAVRVASAEPVPAAKTSARTAPAQQVYMTAAAEPTRPGKTATARTAAAQETYVTASAAPTAKSARVSAKPTLVAMQEPMEEPDVARFGGTLTGGTSNKRVISSVEGEPQEASMGFQSTPENTDAIGAMIVSQGRPLETN